uniref:MULE transposase domain-containing protein n=1 Tax=Ditylenchus dipsaci TaxID=166011 RepID=A0A915CX99_9BILA
MKKLPLTPARTIPLMCYIGRIEGRSLKKGSSSAMLFRLLGMPVAGLRLTDESRRVHFDCETGAYTAFQRYFPEIDVKFCAFHVEQGLNRQIQARVLRWFIEMMKMCSVLSEYLGPAISQS